MFARLDAEVFRLTSGDKAAETYKHALSATNPLHYAQASEYAVKQARFRKGPTEEAGHADVRTCNKCGEEVHDGYKAHNASCREGKKKKKGK